MAALALGEALGLTTLGAAAFTTFLAGLLGAAPTFLGAAAALGAALALGAAFALGAALACYQRRGGRG